MRGIRKTVTLGTVLAGVMLVIFTVLSSTMSKVYAAPAFNWVDGQTIRATEYTDSVVTNVTMDFVDSNGRDTTYEYEAMLSSPRAECNKAKILINSSNPGSGSLLTYTSSGGGATGAICTENRSQVSIGSVANFNKDLVSTGPDDYRGVTYSFGTTEKISASGTITDVFTKNADGKYYRDNDPSTAASCRDYITPNSTNPAVGTLIITKPAGSVCNTTSVNISINNSQLIKADPDAAADAANKDEDTACSLASGTSIGAKTVSWFTCPTHETINRAVGLMDDWINSQLQPDLTIFDKSGNYHAAWNSFRVIALALVVIAALIMVITQAAGMDLLDAYTVRKVLPRLLVAAIFITISWDVLEVLYRLSDAATTGVRSLIYAPFSSLDPIQLGGGSAFSAVLLGVGAWVGLGWAALLSFALSAAIAVALAFFILVLIKIALSGLLIVSALAIACSILPGTQKAYEFWKGALISLLLAPVVVAAVIALFRVGAVIAYNRGEGNAAINQVIASLLYFGAYFAILKALSMVGGVAASLTGAVADRGRGMLDGLKKFRRNQFKNNVRDAAAGNRFQSDNFMARGFNATTRGMGAWAASDNKMGMLRPGLTRKSREKRRAAWQAGLTQHDEMNQQRYGSTDRAKANQHNDPMLQAQTYRTEAQARENMARDWGITQQQAEAAIQAAKAGGGFGYQQQMYATRQLARTGTGYKDLKQMHKTVSRVAGDNVAARNALLGGMNSDTKNAGRYGLAAGHNNHMRIQESQRRYEAAERTWQQARADSAAGRISGAQYTAARDTYDAEHQLYEADIRRGYVDAFRGNDTTAMGRSKNQDMVNVMPAVREAIVEARNSGNNEEAAELSQSVANYEQSKMYFSPDNARTIQQEAVIPLETPNPARQNRSLRDEFAEESREHSQVFNAQTGRLETEYVTKGVTNLAGQPVIDPRTGRQQRRIVLERSTIPLVDPATGAPVLDPVSGRPVRVANPNAGRPIPVPNTAYNPDTARGTEAVRGTRPYDPNDPRNR